MPDKEFVRHPPRRPLLQYEVDVLHFKASAPDDSGISPPNAAAGFTIVEMLISLVILTLGLLAAGQLMFLAMSAQSLSRSKGMASIVAQDRLESLADLYRQNTAAADLTVGNHGPVQVQVQNTTNNSTLNRFSVVWNVAVVPDTRGKVLTSRIVRVTVTPINAGGTANNQAGLNKIIHMSSIFSQKIQ